MGTTKEGYSMRARIEGMENGCVMIVRRHETTDSQGTVVLKRVYVDFQSLVEDLEKIMKFNWPKK